jgi:hypothetical protein
VTSHARKPQRLGQPAVVDNHVEGVGTVWGVAVDEWFTTLWTAHQWQMYDAVDLHRHRPPGVEDTKMLGGSPVWAVPFGRGRQSS